MFHKMSFIQVTHISFVFVQVGRRQWKPHCRDRESEGSEWQADDL